MDSFQFHVLFIAVSVLLTVVTDARTTPLGCSNSNWLRLPKSGSLSSSHKKPGVYCYRTGSVKSSWSLFTQDPSSVHLAPLRRSLNGPLALENTVSPSLHSRYFAVVVESASGAHFQLRSSPLLPQYKTRTLVGENPIVRRIREEEEKAERGEEPYEQSEEHHSDSEDSDSSDEKDGLSPGAIAAIAVGGAVVVGAAVAGICFLCVCRPKKQQKTEKGTEMGDYDEEAAEGELPAPGAPLPAEGVPAVVEGEKFEPKFDTDDEEEEEEDDDGSSGDDESEESEEEEHAGAIL